MEKIKNYVFAALLLLVNACTSTTGTNTPPTGPISPGTTVVGTTTVSAFTVDENGMSLTRLSGGQATLTVTSDVISAYPTGSTQDDLTIRVLLDGQAIASFDQNDFEETSASLLSRAIFRSAFAETTLFTLAITGTEGQVVTLVLSLGATTQPQILQATLSSSESPSFAQVESATPTTAESQAIAAGTAAFENVDLATAESEFCELITAGSINSKVAFGCFLSKLLLLPENSASVQLLADFEEDPFDVEVDLLANVVQFVDHGIDSFAYTDYTSLPLYSEIAAFSGVNDFPSFVDHLDNTSTTLLELLDDTYDQFDSVAELEALILITLADTDFSYTIPEELFYAHGDVLVTYNDLRLMAASVHAGAASLMMTQAYEPGIDLDDSYDGGSFLFRTEVLVHDLNGTGETVGSITVDSTPFLTARDLSVIPAAKTRYYDALSYKRIGLQAILDGDPTDMFEDSIDSFSLTDAVTYAEDLIESMESEGMVALTSFGAPQIEIDLYTFFANPPSAADVTGSDPFVFNSANQHMEVVESYFEELLQDVANF